MSASGMSILPPRIWIMKRGRLSVKDDIDKVALVNVWRKLQTGLYNEIGIIRQTWKTCSNLSMTTCSCFYLPLNTVRLVCAYLFCNPFTPSQTCPPAHVKPYLRPPPPPICLSAPSFVVWGVQVWARINRGVGVQTEWTSAGQFILVIYSFPIEVV